jgi:hypothetical protein
VVCVVALGALAALSALEAVQAAPASTEAAAGATATEAGAGADAGSFNPMKALRALVKDAGALKGKVRAWRVGEGERVHALVWVASCE